MAGTPNLLVEEWQNIVPQNSALSFTDAVEVENYFGKGSIEGNEALNWFAKYPNSTMYFTRDRLGQRPHDLSGNIANLTTTDLQAISGTLSLTWNGWSYSGNLDNSTVSGTQAQAANATVANIRVALNTHRPILATATIMVVPETVTFTGSVDKAQVTVTKILSDTGGLGVVDGGILSGPGIATPGVGSQIIHDHNLPGSKGGPGSYSTFHSAKTSASGTYTLTYGEMTVSSVLTGTIRLGMQVNAPGLTGLSPQTGVDKLLSVGTGGQTTWIVDNAGNLPNPVKATFQQPLLGIYLNRDGNIIQGATENNEIIDVSVQGPFGFDTNKSPAMSWVGGTAAPLLHLAQGSGALTPSEGGDAFSVAQMMDLETQYLDQNGQPISFQDVFSNDPRLDSNIQAWANANGYTYLTTVPAANIAAAHDLLGGPGFHPSTFGAARGYQETAILAAGGH